MKKILIVGIILLTLPVTCYAGIAYGYAVGSYASDDVVHWAYSEALDKIPIGATILDTSVSIEVATAYVGAGVAITYLSPEELILGNGKISVDYTEFWENWPEEFKVVVDFEKNYLKAQKSHPKGPGAY